MIAYRRWFLSNNLRLVSPHYGGLWDGPERAADVAPSGTNSHGIYAYDLSLGHHKLGTRAGEVGGFVDLSGKIVEHQDGIIRAERARILAFVEPDEIGVSFIPGPDTEPIVSARIVENLEQRRKSMKDLVRHILELGRLMQVSMNIRPGIYALRFTMGVGWSTHPPTNEDEEVCLLFRNGQDGVVIMPAAHITPFPHGKTELTIHSKTRDRGIRLIWEQTNVLNTRDIGQVLKEYYEVPVIKKAEAGELVAKETAQ